MKTQRCDRDDRGSTIVKSVPMAFVVVLAEAAGKLSRTISDVQCAEDRRQ